MQHPERERLRYETSNEIRVIRGFNRYGDLLCFNSTKAQVRLYLAQDLYPISFKYVQMQPFVKRVHRSSNYLFVGNDVETYIYDMSKEEGIELRKQIIYNKSQVNAMCSITISGVQFMMLGSWRSHFDLVNTDDQILNQDNRGDCAVFTDQELNKL